MLSRIEYFLKHNIVAQKLYIAIFSMIFRFIGLFVKKDPRKVLLQSLKGKDYGDSPKALFEAMKKDPAFHGFTYVWAFDDPEKFDVDGAKKVNFNSLAYFIEALRAGVWVANVNIERGLRFKPKKTVYLNTWHGSAPLKKDGNAQRGRADYNFSNIDLICSVSDWQDGFFVNDMRAKTESLIRCGMPRNDVLYDVSEERICALKEKFGIPLGKKVILYAPTWRESKDGGKSCAIAPPINLEDWKTELSDEYVVLFRMHLLTTEAMNITYDEFVRDFSGSYDVNELMMVSDILISDYSSMIGDYSILERPILFFAYDYEAYYNQRGLYKRLEELLPGNVFQTEADLLEAIKNIDFDAQCKKTCVFKKQYAYPFGNSTQVCIDALKQKLGENK